MFLKTVESWIFVDTRPRQYIKLIDAFRAYFVRTAIPKKKVFCGNFKSVTESTTWNFDILYVLYVLDLVKVYF